MSISQVSELPKSAEEFTQLMIQHNFPNSIRMLVDFDFRYYDNSCKSWLRSNIDWLLELVVVDSQTNCYNPYYRNSLLAPLSLDIMGVVMHFFDHELAAECVKKLRYIYGDQFLR